MLDVTVLFLDETFSSTAIGPMEVFRHAGELWNVLTGKKPDPPFRVTTASVGGRPVNCDGGLRIQTIHGFAQALLASFPAEAGISRGDLILEINRKPVNSVAEVKSAIDGAGDRPILLLMTRRGQTIYLTVKP